MDIDRKNVYRDIDIKGAGYADLAPETAMMHNEDCLAVQQWQLRKDNKDNIYWGLLGRKEAETDSKISEEFAEKGIRTQRTIAIIDLLELPLYENDATRLVPIEELRRQHLLKDDFNPVVQIRAFGTKTRVADILNYTNSTQSLEKLGDARLMYQYETSDRSEGFLNYANWFADQLGTLVGKMHQSGYTHGYLTPHNLTLDCRLSDLAWVRKKQDFDGTAWQAACENDFIRAHQSLSRFVKGLEELIPAEFDFEGEQSDLEKYLAICTDAYRRAMTADQKAS